MAARAELERSLISERTRASRTKHQASAP
ncbi:MAG: hypothetical protein QHC89_18885 [Bosea sp. (in: a-proteobacteria)]|nr:hypothetical protein [Bosea sp. (in: a-proteobacteria)]